ncbi:sodium:proton antiporter [Ferrimonas sediminicola]|uniref:Sodium:proton antiporter n=1 Tax=Ferrimonas sediminicola TaxID=2569538 RepID=A0A4U1BFL2_9GAMM|nr:Na+/H+ antiporter NhaC family protein [Ferrimonas sediminicola]TKB48795.1 sodium:proton antiporter [Ferrimonas sediminicola]
MTKELLSLAPVVLTIGMALVVRRTLLALGSGLLLAALILHWGAALDPLLYLMDTFTGQLYANGQWQGWHLDVILTIALLGILTQQLARSGAVSAFAHWLFPRIRSRRQARLAVVALGWMVFIDGIFSCLANGNVSRPLCERYRISNTQLAYLVDSTASPLCAILPFSSWGPYVMTLLAGLTILPGAPLTAFLQVAATNFYALITLALAVLVAWSNLGFGSAPVRPEQVQAQPSREGSPWLLGLPVLMLIGGSLVLAILSGLKGGSTPMQWLANADIGGAMRNAALGAVLLSLGLQWRQGIRPGAMLFAGWMGLRSVATALGILMMTWMVGRAIGDLETGRVMATWASTHLAEGLLLPGIFLLCAVTAFATGSSWGTFALMIPIGADIAWQLQPQLLLPALSAVMAGSVFGDHCSPISDTTVLSATASGCAPVDHVSSQLPLALISAGLALVGFTLLGQRLPLVLVWPLMLVLMGLLAAMALKRRPGPR